MQILSTRTSSAPLELENTFYRNDPRYLHHPGLVNSYWDVLENGKPGNVTRMQRVNVSSFKGDDGIVCTPTDAVKFFKGLMEGKLLSPASMAEMQKWVKDETGKPRYGMGLYNFDLFGIPAYGHGGGGIGAGCILLYFPIQKTYAFLSVNLDVLSESALTRKVEEMKTEILMAMFK